MRVLCWWGLQAGLSTGWGGVGWGGGQASGRGGLVGNPAGGDAEGGGDPGVGDAELTGTRCRGRPAGSAPRTAPGPSRPPVRGAGEAEAQGRTARKRGQPGPSGEGGGDKDARSPPGLWLDLRRLPQRHCSICEPFSRRSPRILMDFTLWRPPAPRKRDRPRSGRLSAAGRRAPSPPNFPAHRRGPAAPGGGRGTPPSLLGTCPPAEGRPCREAGRAGWKDVKP